MRTVAQRLRSRLPHLLPLVGFRDRPHAGCESPVAGPFRTRLLSVARELPNVWVSSCTKRASDSSSGGPSDFKTLLAEDDDRLAEAVLEKLATYALMRVMTVDDVQ